MTLTARLCCIRHTGNGQRERQQDCFLDMLSKQPSILLIVDARIFDIINPFKNSGHAMM